MTAIATQQPAAKRASLPRRLAARQFSSLAEYNYRVFFIGQSVSLIGTWMQTVGQAWLVLQLTGSATALGVLTMLQFLPFTLLSLFGGVLADRLPKRKTLIAVQSLATVQATVLATIVITGYVELWHIYVLAFLLGTTNAIERPTRQSFFSELVPKEHLVNAVALNSSILNVARILGPALGGLAIAAIGVQATFVFNAFSFLAVVAGYLVMRPKDFYAPRARPLGGKILPQVLDGIRYAVGTPSVLAILILVAAIGTFGYNFNVTIPLIARFLLDVGPERFGLLSSSLGAGALISAFTIAGGGERSLRFMATAASVFSIVTLLLGLCPWYWGSTVLLLLLGAAGAALMTSANTTLQLHAPDELRGRIISIFILLQAGSTPVGGLITGLLSSALGVPTGLVILGLLCFVGVAGTALYTTASQGHVNLAPAPSARFEEATDT